MSDAIQELARALRDNPSALIDRLRKLSAATVSTEGVPIPASVCSLLSEAANTIHRLNEKYENVRTLSRLAAVGPSFAEIKSDLRVTQSAEAQK